MKNLSAILWLLLALVPGTAAATTSTINPANPAQNAPLASAPVRANFLAAYNDINNIYSIVSTIVGVSAQGPTGAIQYNAGAGVFGGATLGGDCTYTPPNITCTGTNGVLFAPSATTNTTNASNITSGTLPAAQVPFPTLSTIGGVKAVGVVSHQVINSISTAGVPSQVQLACSDLSNGSASCSTDTTNAGNISSGTLPDAQLSTTAKVRNISVTFDGGGVPLSAGKVVYLSNIPYAGTITGVTMLADVSGSAVVDIWKTTFSGAPPTIANTITASALPTLSSAQKSNNTTLSGWATSIAAGDTMAFKLNSASTLTYVNLTLQVTIN